MTLCGIGGIILAATTSASSEPLRVLGVFGIALLCGPLSVGIALLKFHLYDIDKAGQPYPLLCAPHGTAGGTFIGLVAFDHRRAAVLIGGGGGGVDAWLPPPFNPLRKRLQRIVDRRFNRARYDADATIAAFTARLRDAVDLETVRSELLEVVNRAVEPAHASVWIRQHKPDWMRLDPTDSSAASAPSVTARADRGSRAPAHG